MRKILVLVALTASPPPAYAEPLVWTHPCGIGFCTVEPGLRWVSFRGVGGQIPPNPPHLQVIDRWQEGDVWYISGQMSAPYVSYLAAPRGSTVTVRFAGDIDSPHSTWNHFEPADTNGDGVVNSADISEFLVRWAWPPLVSSPSDVPHPADWNCDGEVNSSDISAFLTAWRETLE